MKTFEAKDYIEKYTKNPTEAYTNAYLENEAVVDCSWLLNRAFEDSVTDLEAAEQSKDDRAIQFYKKKVAQLSDLCAHLDTTASAYARCVYMARRELINDLELEAAEQCIACLTQKVIEIRTKD